MSDQPTNGNKSGIDPTSSPSDRVSHPKADRRKVLKLMGAASAGLAGPGLGATYLRGFEYTRSVQAQGNSPVKIGFIEDESGNLSVYGIRSCMQRNLRSRRSTKARRSKVDLISAPAASARSAASPRTRPPSARRASPSTWSTTGARRARPR